MSEGKPAAKQGDTVTGTDNHIVLVPGAGGTATPTAFPFAGVLDGELVSDVVCEGMPLAVEGSKATNQPPHIAAGGVFQSPPSNRATVQTASTLVFAAGKGVARAGDTAMTCNDPTEAPNGTVVAAGTVFVG